MHLYRTIIVEDIYTESATLPRRFLFALLVFSFISFFFSSFFSKLYGNIELRAAFITKSWNNYHEHNARTWLNKIHTLYVAIYEYENIEATSQNLSFRLKCIYLILIPLHLTQAKKPYPSRKHLSTDWGGTQMALICFGCADCRFLNNLGW